MGQLFGDDRGAVFRRHIVSSRDGLRLSIRDYGQRNRPAVLCLTGVTRNARDFHPLASALADRFRVLVFDYRGRGRSEWASDWRQYTPRVYLADISDMLTALDIGQCAVVGTSLGGLLAFAMGVAMPTRLRGALINDIGPAIPDAAIAPVRDFLAEPGRYADRSEARQKLQSLFPDLPAADDADWRVLVDATFVDRGDGFLVPDWDPAIGRSLTAPPPPEGDLWRLFDSLARLPLGLVRGAKSKFLTRELVERMKARRPDMAVAEIDGVGHAPSLIEPAALELVEHWLARCWSEENFRPGNG